MQGLERLKMYAEQIGCAYCENEPMSRHTSFKIGGNADIMLTPQNKETLSFILTACKRWEVPCYVLGNGSNVLVSDTGIRGAVVLTSGLDDIRMVDTYTIECGAGVKNSRLCSFALENSLSGFEFLWGIPGTVGGGAYMNAGAYGGEMKDIFIQSEHINDDGSFGSYNADEIDYGYRKSAYSEHGGVITSITLRGTPAEQSAIRARMDELMNRRKDKQPLEYPSAGSVFKRPEGYYAAALIEECGLKGLAHGDAMVSEKHSGFIVNTGNATASDVKILIEKIKEQVFLQKDVRLECEIKFLG